MGSKLLQVYTGIQVKSISLNTLCVTDFKMEMSMGVSLLRTVQSLLTGQTIPVVVFEVLCKVCYF